MKRKLLCTFCFILTVLTAAAQDSLETLSPTVKYLIKRHYTFPDSLEQNQVPDSLQKWPDTVYYNTVYVAKVLGSPSIPLSFSKIELQDGKYQVSPTISIGYGYTWFKGEFIFNETDKITINPKMFFGLAGAIGLDNSLNLDKLTSVFAGGFIGISSFCLFVGYDFVSYSPSINIGGRIDLFTIKQDFLKPIGKVRELRKHKRAAIPVIYE
jgi:hypothetical protein